MIFKYDFRFSREGVMKKLIIFTACIIIGTAGCFKKSRMEMRALEKTETEFIGAFLKSKFPISVSRNVPLVIKETPSMHKLTIGENPKRVCFRLIQAAEMKDARFGPAVTDFCEKNTGDDDISFIGTIPVNHILLAEEQEDAVFDTIRNGGRDGWKVFYETYPKSPGIITLSRPGFNPEKNIAVIYMGNEKNWLRGYGRIYFFQKKNGVWEDMNVRIGPSWLS